MSLNLTLREALSVKISVRTLHHYKEIGLLRPSGRNEGGHRLYSEQDVTKLQQIMVLRELGLPLEEIKRCFLGLKFSSLEIMRIHKARLEQEKHRLDRLYQMVGRLEQAMMVRESSIEELIRLMEVMNMHEKYFTKEQLKKLTERRQQMGEEAIRKTQEEWPRLITAVRDEMKKYVLKKLKSCSLSGAAACGASPLMTPDLQDLLDIRKEGGFCVDGATRFAASPIGISNSFLKVLGPVRHSNSTPLTREQSDLC